MSHIVWDENKAKLKMRSAWIGQVHTLKEVAGALELLRDPLELPEELRQKFHLLEQDLVDFLDAVAETFMVGSEDYGLKSADVIQLDREGWKFGVPMGHVGYIEAIVSTDKSSEHHLPFMVHDGFEWCGVGDEGDSFSTFDSNIIRWRPVKVVPV